MGLIGQVQLNILNNFDIKNEEVVIFELELNKFIEHSEKIINPIPYKSFSKFPESTRDLALILDNSVMAEEILEEVKRIRLVKNVEIFDVFQAKDLPRGKKSLGIRLIIVSDNNTLTTDEIQRLETEALIKLNKRFGAELRG